MVQDLMNYNLMVKKALRSVIRDTLQKIATSGLPGGHHLYVKFRTDLPDVDIADWLKEKHPHEMVIVLQHQFWGLVAAEDYFEISLNFNKVAEQLHVPYDAVVSFYDPSVQFGLDFDVGEDPAKTEAGAHAPGREIAGPVKGADYSGAEKKAKSGDTGDEPADGASEENTDKDGNVVTLDAFRKK